MSGKRVVRLEGGDPFVFGGGGEEAQALALAGVRFEIVPGVTPGIEPTTTVDWLSLAKIASTATVVLYMGVNTLPSIVKALMDGGLSADTPAAAVQLGTHSPQRTVVATVATIAERATAEGISAPGITVIGPSASLRSEIARFELRPLFGKRIVVTRATGAGGNLGEQLREMGAEVIEAPVTTIEALAPGPIDTAVANIASYGWLILTSQVGVRLFWEALRRAGKDTRALNGIRVAVIGPATRRTLEEYGLTADVTPKRFVAEGLLESLTNDSTIRGARVLYAAAADSREVLSNGLRDLGASVDMVAMYRSVPDEAVGTRLNAIIDAGEVDIITFASGSAVDGFVSLVGEARARKMRAVTIGPITSAAARKQGIVLVAEAAEATIDSLVDAVLQSEARVTTSAPVVLAELPPRRVHEVARVVEHHDDHHQPAKHVD